MEEIKTRMAAGDAAEVKRRAVETGLSVSAVTRQLLIQALHSGGGRLSLTLMTFLT